MALPEGLQRLGSMCFADCCVKVLELPRSILRVDPDVLGTVRGEIRFAQGTEVIPRNVLRKCKCASVVIPASVRLIGESAFSGAAMKTVSFAFGSCLEQIGPFAFHDSQVGPLLIPDSVVTICAGAFSDCHNLSKVMFMRDSKLAEIGQAAFRGSWLEKFDAPASLRTIGDEAFVKCTKLKSAKLNEGLQMVGYHCFDQNALVNVKMSEPQRVAWWWKIDGWDNLRDITLPDSLQYIGRGWFFWTKIESVTIPKSVRVIEELAFADS